MKLIIVAISLIVFIFPAVSPAAENQPAGEETRQIDREESMEEQFRKLGKALDELKAKIGPMTEQAGKEVKRYREGAGKMQKENAARLEELHKAAEKQWKKLTDELNTAIAELEKAFERAKPEAGKDPGNGK